jgi:DNA polymerase-3 subunit gamma/tau
MSYQVLARKWRPRNFAEMVGQEHVVRALSNALDHDRLHHAYLFTGTRGVGKTTLARILAKSLNCEQGVSASPCGECSCCREIDEGRFVDLLEVDAASRTKVDQTRELLEQVPYAPVRGRYKVYLIDEVHMFSDSSFNALLKTLEEPPPHVKFLLATTDPQKVPVTVLSRCLQFNLKRLPIEQIQGQFQHILETEAVSYEPPALFLLARAADGSMRDGLSLLDQAIGYGGGAVREHEVKAMLGVVAVDRLPDLLEAVHAGDGAQVLERVQELGEQAPDFAGLLRDLLTLLHRVAVLQAVPDAVDPSWGDPQRLRGLAVDLAPEDVQLYYQIGLLGQRDLPLAPDPRSGFEMTLLRMLAFRPAGGAGSDEAPQGAARQPAAGRAQAPSAERPAAPRPQAAAAPARPPTEVKATAVEPGPAAAVDLADWHAVLPRLGLGGMAAQLANNCSVAGWDGRRLELQLDPVCQGLLGSRAEASLRTALAQLAGDELDLRIAVGQPAAETPAQRGERNRAEAQQRAVESMRQDPVVKVLEEQFDAELMEDSIRPVQS